MNIFRYPNFQEDSAIAIGSFDGMHLGHREIMKHLLSLSGNYVPRVVTFSPTAREFFKNQPSVMGFREKVKILEDIGIQNMVVLPFHAIRHMSAESFFVQVLLRQMRAKYVVVGDSFFFGKDKQGCSNFLQEMGKQWGVEIKVVAAHNYKGVRISSTWIRELLLQGDLDKANHLLGRAYLCIGRVIRGQARGKSLGFPTANISIKEYRHLATGVFIVRVLHQGNWYSGVANLGTRPSFGSQGRMELEVHIFDFNANLYRKFIQVELLHKLRNEIKFTTTDNLVLQIRKDIDQARKWIAKR